jgi:excisionase family DNA binding protein
VTGPAWISTSHAASRLGIGRKKVLNLLNEKRLRGRRPCHKWQVCAASVEAYRRRVENGAAQ